MTHDLTDTTFIIPVRIESEDRLRNVITSVCFLLENFDTRIIIKEFDRQSTFLTMALPQIMDYLEGKEENITHIFEQSDDPHFYRQMFINQMLDMVETEVVGNYDSDVLLPIDSIIESQRMIVEDEADVVYPYGWGTYQEKIPPSDQLVSEFLSNDCDFSVFEGKTTPDRAESGHVQFIRTSSYREAGMENENFVAYAPEDKERLHRFRTLGYRVGRLEKKVYHLEHARTPNSWINNPHMNNNLQLWDFLQSLNEEELRQYYKEQKYLKKYQ